MVVKLEYTTLCAYKNSLTMNFDPLTRYLRGFYLTILGPGGDGDATMTMLEIITELFRASISTGACNQRNH